MLRISKVNVGVSRKDHVDSSAGEYAPQAQYSPRTNATNDPPSTDESLAGQFQHLPETLTSSKPEADYAPAVAPILALVRQVSV